ncbi:TetR/AcrR family transcriptional regulator [Kineococcus rhizosphaerae]|uniref:TetR family transcriptional regulator n=1 Tax=Kineococcus rhizosphaerae TaxID=559628 RepID=A0A2T0R727_9ACTN|nr:TetR/AcrR family transcriptional regulator [Kineococcus rhizosphaerae]PRY16967.1 TetR family transcriptional regulator [Kineococcus rhizosphaerae]
MSTTPVGRPRSESARRAVLQAVDDLLAEVGYAGVTMKGIADRAGVGRQTVYRWWSTTAEILLEACVADARDELRTVPQPDARRDVLGYLRLLEAFLLHSHAGLCYRVLLGETQHDGAVRELVARADILAPSARACLRRVGPRLQQDLDHDLHVAELVGPVVYAVLTTGGAPDLEALTDHLLAGWSRGGPAGA